MDKIDIKIANKIFKVSIAESDEELEKGLQGVKDLPKDEGMLFIFGDPDEISIWMKDTLIPLDIIFLNADLEVIKVQKGEPNNEDLITEKDVSYVLELNAHSGIKKGDTLEFSPEAQVRSDKMMVLNEDGSSQMDLEGGERIFSRANTKILIKFAKKAKATKSDRDYKALGKRVFKFLKAQDENEPEYV